MRFRIPLALAILLAGLAYSLLPRGIFGAHDVALRSVICGATAAAAALLLVVLNKRSITPHNDTTTKDT